MRRRVLILLLSMGVLLLFAAPASAASVSVTATVSGTTINATVSGTADDCTLNYCDAQTVDIVVQELTSPGIATCIDDSPSSFGPANTIIGSEAVPVTGGSFSLTAASASEPGGQYFVCGYIDQTSFGTSMTWSESSPVTVTVPPQACPAGSSQALSLKVPGELVFGRGGTITVRQPGWVNLSPSVDSAGLEMRGRRSGRVFATYTFTGSDLSNLSSGLRVRLLALLNSYDGTASVTLSYIEDITNPDTSYVTCSMAQTATIVGFKGAVPRVILAKHGVALLTPYGCSLARIIPARIIVRGNGANFRIKTKDECSGKWVRHGRLKGIRVRTVASNRLGGVAFSPSGANGTYQVTVSVGTRVVKRGVLTASYHYHPGWKIWQGTDAFVNYCINGGFQTYSQNLQLYCWHPGWATQSLSLHKR